MLLITNRRYSAAVKTLVRTSVLLLIAIGSTCWPEEVNGALILAHSPTLSSSQIVFVYGGYLWAVPRAGGRASQLTTGGHEDSPHFSPDGKWIAFTGQYDGNADVYVMPADGGEPRRLTWHPGPEIAVGWTPDSRRILFRSGRDAYAYFERFYTVPVEGGWAEVLPMWSVGSDGSFSPDGTQIAYLPHLQLFKAWKGYRGGQTTPIYIVRLRDLALESVPRENSNDSNPLWVGDKIYFLSDRNGSTTLFAYDTRSKLVRQVVDSKGVDLDSVSAGPDSLVYDQLGQLYLFDPNGGRSTRVAISIAGDLPATRPHYENVADKINNSAISPTGTRAVFEARGEILTVPAEKGDIHNLTRTTGAAERDPAWSPDGKWIAYFSDESGEYALHVRDQSGSGPVRKINLGSPPSYFYDPKWSPDSKKIAYLDRRLNCWYVDIDKGIPVKVDTDLFHDSPSRLTVSWSPDSQWLAYDKYTENHQRSIFVYSLKGGAIYRLTDSLVDARYPIFDKSGKEMYFAVTTDLGLTVGSVMEHSSYERPVLRRIYAVALQRGETASLAAHNDEEQPEDQRKSIAGDADSGKGDNGNRRDDNAKVLIDIDRIQERMVALPIKIANYVSLQAGREGVFFAAEALNIPSEPKRGPVTVTKFELTRMKAETLLTNVESFSVSANGERMLYRQSRNWFIRATSVQPQPGEEQLNLAGMDVLVDPRAEWEEMFLEVYRIERDFFYAPTHNGLDLAAQERRYAPLIKGIGGREDLNDLFIKMTGELANSHHIVFGGDTAEVKKVANGLLGADYKIENGRYRIARIFEGDRFNPDARAPLSQPGVDVRTGEYLLAVDGLALHSSDNIDHILENTADKRIRITVGPFPDGKDARDLDVIPVASERTLRQIAWEEDNRRKVDQLSGGKIAYIHISDTRDGGYGKFNRFYFGQLNKQAVIVDVRFNGGGLNPDDFVDELERPLRFCVTTREGEKFCSPMAQIYGPKTMIINEMSGSAGEMLPWMFQADKDGPLVGTRTWGGVHGLVCCFPLPLLDGGVAVVSSMAMYGLHGQWDVENRGVIPDVEVENDPASVAAGHDLQLEKAVQITLDALKNKPLTIPDHPPYL